MKIPLEFLFEKINFILRMLLALKLMQYLHMIFLYLIAFRIFKFISTSFHLFFMVMSLNMSFQSFNKIKS